MQTLRTRGLAAALVTTGLLLAGAAAPARAIPLAGDRTTLDVTSFQALSGLGVTLSGLGSTIVFSNPGAQLFFAIFPVTGGDVDLPNSFAGTIEHAGSGLRLSVLGADLDLSNLLVNTSAGAVTGDVSSAGAATVNLSLFDIVPCSGGLPGTCLTQSGLAFIPTGYGLRVASDLATKLDQVLGLSGLSGFQLGVANTALLPVPEPGSALLLGGALTALCAGRRTRHRA